MAMINIIIPRTDDDLALLEQLDAEGRLASGNSYPTVEEIEAIGPPDEARDSSGKWSKNLGHLKDVPYEDWANTHVLPNGATTGGFPAQYIEMTPGGKGYTEAEEKAVKSYKLGSGPINRSAVLIGDSPNTKHYESGTIAALDSAISKAATTRDLVVYRGLIGDYAQRLVDHLKPGEIYEPHSFQEATTWQEVAWGNFSDSDKLILQVHVPKGTPALPTDQIVPNYAGERGMLFSRHTRYKVNKKYKSKGKVYMDVDLLKE